VFFSQLEGQSFTDAFRYALPIAGGPFLAAAMLALVLPRTAVSEDEAAEELAG
jgi:hypothetical protein